MKIIIDRYNLYQPSKTDFKVVDETTYRQARRMLLEYLVHEKITSEVIYISMEPYSSWFRDVPSYCQEITPRSFLAQQHPGIVLPTGLSNEHIHELELLKLSIKPTEQVIFKYFLGIDIPNEKISIPSLYQLCQVCVSHQDILKNDYISGIWKRHLVSMKSQDGNLLDALLENVIAIDKEFSRIVSEGIYCAKNKYYRENWLHDHKRYLLDFNVSIDSLELLLIQDNTIYPLNEKLERSVYFFILQQFKGIPFDCKQISGRYIGEAEAIIELKPQLSMDELGQLNEYFAGHLTLAQLDSISKLCKPIFIAYPRQESVASLSQQAISWVSWATESFIPFKTYYDEQKIDVDNLKIIESSSEAYSDWYFSNYSNIIRDTDILTNLDVVRKIRGILDETDTKVIWLIIDGFPVNYTPILSNLLKKFGINKVSMEYSFATLPTITEVNIPVMLAGYYDRDVDLEQYGRQELLQNALNTQAAIYSSIISNFKDLLREEYDVCCLHTTEIDALLHLNDHQLDTSRTVRIERILETKVKLISEVIKDSTDKKIKLVISTDHGATKCLNKGQKIKNTRLEEASLGIAGERSVPLKGSLLEEQFDKNDLYVLTKESGNNKLDWAMARGYRYFGRQDSGYRHGGLSPEETIVPLLICEVAPVTHVQLSIRYIGEKDLPFDKTERNFKIKIRNTGITTVEILDVVVEEDSNCLFTLPVQIASETESTLTAAIKLPRKLQSRAKDGKLDIKFKLSCLVLGERIEQIVMCPVTTVRNELDDFFNF